MNLNLDALREQGVTVKQFCGIPLSDDVNICPEEAIGELTVTLDNGMEVPMPICAAHLEQVQNIRTV